MIVKIYQTEDKQHFASAKIDNTGRYDEQANCFELEVKIPEEIEMRSFLGGKPEPIVKKNGVQAYFTEIEGQLVVKTLTHKGRKPKIYPVEILSKSDNAYKMGYCQT